MRIYYSDGLPMVARRRLVCDCTGVSSSGIVVAGSAVSVGATIATGAVGVTSPGVLKEINFSVWYIGIESYPLR